ncbi:hypothetical protein FQA39_LY16888 [Lamprigera yunnana]|nr:hypothetical protein FQA39_LY16888 [Lamprigera yunnana]
MVDFGYHACAVLDCKDIKSTRHRFPNPKEDGERFQKWVQLCCNPKLFTMESTRIYNSLRVCHIHFPINELTSNMYIKRTSVPSLYMPLGTETSSCVTSETQEERQGLSLDSTLGAVVAVGTDFTEPAEQNSFSYSPQQQTFVTSENVKEILKGSTQWNTEVGPSWASDSPHLTFNTPTKTYSSATKPSRTLFISDNEKHGN